jgi:hypothetical protein
VFSRNLLQDSTGHLYVTTSSKDTRFAIWSTENLDKSTRSDFVSLNDKGALCTQTWMNDHGSTTIAPAPQWCSTDSIKKTNIAAIAGGIAAGIAIILAAAVVLLCRRRKQQNDKDTTAVPAATSTTSNGNSSNSTTTATKKASSRAVQESATPRQTSRHHNSSSSTSNGHGRPSLVMILSEKSFTSDKDIETGDSNSDSLNDVNTASAINRGKDRTVHRLPQQKQDKRADTTDTTVSTSTSGNRDVAAKTQQRQAATTGCGITNDSSTTGAIRRGSGASSGSTTASSGTTSTTATDSKASGSGLTAMSASVTSAVKAGIDKHGAKAGIVWEGLGQVAEHIPYVRFAYGKYIN